MEIVVARHIDIFADILVATIFLIERVRGILQVARDEKLATTTCHDDADTTIGRLSNELQIGIGEDILAMHLSMATVRHLENIVEATEDGQLRVEGILREDAKHFTRQRIFGYAIVVEESCLGSPTYI